MASVSLAQETVTVESCTATVGPLPQKALGITSMLDAAEAETTDIGQTSATETESSCASSDEDGHIVGKVCRFGMTSLETVPATPSAGALSLTSPPGFSRAAMRQARDACKPESLVRSITETRSSGNASLVDAVGSTSKTLCRFGVSAFGTVPKTPVNGSKWKALAEVVGSPPGLSRAEERQSRDACKAPIAAATTWGRAACQLAGSPDPFAFDSAMGTSKRHVARGKLVRMKQEAALLKEIPSRSGRSDFDSQDIEVSCHDLADTEDAIDVGHSSSSEEECPLDVFGTQEQQCRFGSTSLGTHPKTPKNASGAFSSPPGLSRKAMRQARDSCKGWSAASTTSWASCSAGAAFTINPSGKPMTPVAERAAKRRASRDAAGLGQVLSTPALPQTSEAPR